MSRTFVFDRFDVEAGTVSNIQAETHVVADREGDWVPAQDAINREAVLQAHIRTLEVQLCDARAALATSEASADLENNETYALRIAAISCAASGHWKEGDSIQPDYVTPALTHVAKLYARCVSLHQDAQRYSWLRTWNKLDGWTDEMIDRHIAIDEECAKAD